MGLPGVFFLMRAGERLHPDPQRGDHAVRGLQRLRGEHDPVRDHTAGVLGNIVGSWLAYAAGYYGRIELLEGTG